MSLTKVYIRVSGRLEPLGWIDSGDLQHWRGYPGDVWCWSPPLRASDVNFNEEPSDKLMSKVCFSTVFVNRAPMVVCVEGADRLVDYHGFASFPDGRKFAELVSSARSRRVDASSLSSGGNV